MPELNHKPGQFWGVVGRKNLPLGKREGREVSAKEAVQLPPSRLALWRDKPAIHAPPSLGENTTGKADISAQKPTVAARVYGQAVLQGRVLD